MYAAESTLGILSRAGSTSNIPTGLEVPTRGLEAGSLAALLLLPLRRGAAPLRLLRLLLWHPAMLLPWQEHLSNNRHDWHCCRLQTLSHWPPWCEVLCMCCGGWRAAAAGRPTPR